MEKQGITEERVQVEDGCGSNSTCNAVTDEGQLVKVDLNNNLLQEDGTFSSSVQSEFLVKREDDSSTLNSDNAKAEVSYRTQVLLENKVKCQINLKL